MRWHALRQFWLWPLSVLRTGPSWTNGKRPRAPARHRLGDAVLHQEGPAEGLHEVLPAPTTQPWESPKERRRLKIMDCGHTYGHTVV